MEHDEIRVDAGSTTQPPGVAKTPPDRFQKVIEKLFQREPLSRRAAARLLHLSESGLNRIFPRVMGLTFQQAKSVLPIVTVTQELIENRAVRVTEAAQGMRYFDLRSFDRTFGKYWGTPPTALRDSAPPSWWIAVRVDGARVRLAILPSQAQEAEGVLLRRGVVVVSAAGRAMPESENRRV